MHVLVSKLPHVLVLRSVTVVVLKLACMLVLESPRATVVRVVLLTVMSKMLPVSMHVLLSKLTCLILSSAERWRYDQQRSRRWSSRGRR